MIPICFYFYGRIAICACKLLCLLDILIVTSHMMNSRIMAERITNSRAHVALPNHLIQLTFRCQSVDSSTLYLSVKNIRLQVQQYHNKVNHLPLTCGGLVISTDTSHLIFKHSVCGGQSMVNTVSSSKASLGFRSDKLFLPFRPRYLHCCLYQPTEPSSCQSKVSQRHIKTHCRSDWLDYVPAPTQCLSPGVTPEKYRVHPLSRSSFPEPKQCVVLSQTKSSLYRSNSR